jgi:bifunctional non-homologous end joining protein LigD
MIDNMPNEQWVTAGGRRLKLTNLDKVMYPATGTTKGEVLDYYARVADVLIPFARDRPATRKRWVHGVGTPDKPGQMFFQKNLDDSTPDWVTRGTIEHKDHDNDYPLVNNIATLTWLAQIAALELHVPQWKFGRDGKPKNPDRFVIDLDPGPGVDLQQVAHVARLTKSILTDMGLEPMPVTSGSKGIHLYARLDGRQSSDQVSSVAHELARALEADHPDLIVSDMKKSLRDGKVLVDWSQNSANKTTIVPYSLRGRDRPTVAVPRTWRELASKSLKQLDFTEVLARVAKGRTPELPGTAGSVAEGLEATTLPSSASGNRTVPDRLTTYRSMRDASKTPEPVPDEHSAPGPGHGNSFVIQEHHASRLHWDFRLEHDGVLVSWALPKGVPTETGKNHLAVQTEDHPIEYGGFAGDIPKGEYGAGHVEIWDSGTFELEKWREGKEVIATLHGDKHGTHKYALIHTGGRSEKQENQWLIHLMKDQPTDAAPAPTPERTPSTRKLPSPMLATLGKPGDIDPGDDNWAFEMKWDGIRAIAEVVGGRVRLASRSGIDQGERYPELADLLRAVTVDVVLDGEIVALGNTGRPDFGALQSRMNLSATKDIARAAAATPVHFMLFDIIERDGVDLRKHTYDERRRILLETARSTGAIQVPPAFDGDLDAALSSSLELGLEGIMAKARDSGYVSRRSSDWVKLKHNRTQEVIVAGWRPGAGARANRIGSLLLGVPDGTGIRYVGRVGTGFGNRELDDTLVRLRKIARKTSPLSDVPAADARDANWVRAELVGEVEFAEWTSTGRLRQPRWRGWRTDKSAGDVRLES